MVQIKIKRAYDAYSPEDGFRVLVDRLWPRGIKKEALKYDLWQKEIAPSNALRRLLHEDSVGHWDRFKTLYLAELKQNPAVENFLANLRNHDVVTLIYAAKDQQYNQAQVLKPFLEKKYDRAE